MLHITNGDSVGDTLRQTGLPGDIVIWKDILHEGPTPAGLSLGQMSQLRARFLADCALGTYEEILADFLSRDTTLAQFAAHQEVILWFEHDLYDQITADTASGLVLAPGSHTFHHQSDLHQCVSRHRPLFWSRAIECQPVTLLV